MAPGASSALVQKITLNCLGRTRRVGEPAKGSRAFLEVGRGSGKQSWSHAAEEGELQGRGAEDGVTGSQAGTAEEDRDNNRVRLGKGRDSGV